MFTVTSRFPAWALCLLALSPALSWAAEPAPGKRVPISSAFDLQGHRGARGLLPENTQAAFAKALSIGVTTLEMDLAVSSDGVVVVTHNPRLEPEITRDSTGTWLKETGAAIHFLPLDEIKRFDVGGIQPGTRYARRFPGQQAVRGERIPTLLEVIQLVRRSGNTDVKLNLETKLWPDHPSLAPNPATFVKAVLKIAAAEGFSERITIQSFDWRTLRETQRIAPNVPTVYLTAEQKWLDNIQRGRPGPSPWMAGIDIDDFDGSIPQAIKASGGWVWSPYHREVTAASVAEAHAVGLSVIPWTVNDPSRMETLSDMGVDGIISDYPNLLREVLLNRGIAVPTPTLIGQ